MILCVNSITQNSAQNPQFSQSLNLVGTSLTSVAFKPLQSTVGCEAAGSEKAHHPPA